MKIHDRVVIPPGTEAFTDPGGRIVTITRHTGVITDLFSDERGDTAVVKVDGNDEIGGAQVSVDPHDLLMCPPLDTPVSGIALTDTEALDHIAREMSGEEWSPDTLDVIAAYVRGTGRSIDEVGTVEVWTLTIGGGAEPESVATTVHASRDEAINCLFDNYDPQNIYAPRGSYAEHMQELIDGECLVVHIEPHKVVPL